MRLGLGLGLPYVAANQHLTAGGGSESLLYGLSDDGEGGISQTTLTTEAPLWGFVVVDGVVVGLSDTDYTHLLNEALDTLIGVDGMADLPVSALGVALGIMAEAVLDFQETAGAGTYEASFPIAAGGWIQEVFPVCRGAGPWDADDADLNMGDEEDAEALISGLSLTNAGDVGTTFDASGPTFPDMYEHLKGSGGNYSTGGIVRVILDSASDVTTPGGENFSYQTTAVRTQPGIPYDAPNTITAVLVAAGAGGTTGHVQIIVRGSGFIGGRYDAVKTPA